MSVILPNFIDLYRQCMVEMLGQDAPVYMLQNWATKFEVEWSINITKQDITDITSSRLPHQP